MTDTTATTNTTLWFPTDVWGLIASLLDNDELARFRQVCKLFNDIGSDAMLLQPLYNRLYAMDKTLPATLPTEDTALAFTKAFEMIQARQQQEITYLTQRHPAVMAKTEYVQALQENSSVSLKSLEAKNTLLDTINSEIVTSKITNINSTFLDLDGAHITRLPVTLFQAERYVNFWKNLTELICHRNQLAALNVQGLVALQDLSCYNNQLTDLDVTGLAALQTLWCSDNQLTALNVQGLVALQTLWCQNNQLTALNVQGLAALEYLDCNNNQLTALNVQGLVALRRLDCKNNPLTDLNLMGVSAAIKNEHAELEKTLLFKQLSPSNSVEARREIIARLGAEYTRENCENYCPKYAKTLFDSDANLVVLSSLAKMSIYLPSSSANNMDQTEENTSTAQEKDPEAKLKKKS